MSIKSIDFVANSLSKGILSVPKYESFAEAKAKMNEWIDGNDIEVINIETVVLPEINSKEKSENVGVQHIANPYMTQFIRVWYRDRG